MSKESVARDICLAQRAIEQALGELGTIMENPTSLGIEAAPPPPPPPPPHALVGNGGDSSTGSKESITTAPLPDTIGFDSTINRPLLGSAPMRVVHFDAFPQASAATRALALLVMMSHSALAISGILNNRTRPSSPSPAPHSFKRPFALDISGTTTAHPNFVYSAALASRF